MEYRLHSDAMDVMVSSRGSELIGIKDKDGSDVLWTGDERYWKRHSPILFPFVGRLVEGRYTYREKSYPMTLHGFISNMEFSVAEATDSIYHGIFRSDDSTREIYPFNFTFEVIYRLDQSTLDASFIVTNTGEGTMHYGFGLHPGFCVPMESGSSFEDCFIEFENCSSPMQEIFSESRFDTGKAKECSCISDSRIELRHSLFDDDAICLKGTGSTLWIRSRKGSKAVRVSHDAPFLSLWHTDKSDAPFVCIEPWHSLPAMDGTILDLETKPDFIALGPGQSQTYKLQIDLIS